MVGVCVTLNAQRVMSACRSQLPETPRFSVDVERNDAKALRNVTAVKAGDNKEFVDEYVAGHEMDRISFKKLNHYLTYPSILRNRSAPV